MSALLGRSSKIRAAVGLCPNVCVLKSGQTAERNAGAREMPRVPASSGRHHWNAGTFPLFGLTVVRSTAISPGYFLVGSLRPSVVVLRRRQGLTVQISARRSVRCAHLWSRVIAEVRAALVVYRPVCLCVWRAGSEACAMLVRVEARVAVAGARYRPGACADLPPEISLPSWPAGAWSCPVHRVEISVPAGRRFLSVCCSLRAAGRIGCAG